jgi:CubicO group peptidase (beta-lactamase class C family)
MNAHRHGMVRSGRGLRLGLGLALCALAVAPLSGCGLGNTLKVGTAFKAQTVASGVNVGGRELKDVARNDASWGPLKLVRVSLNEKDRTVTGSFFGLVRTKSIYRPGLGVTLVNGLSEAEIRAQGAEYNPPGTPDLSNVPWPNGDLIADAPLPAGVDAAALEAALDAAFSEPVKGEQLGTRAIVVVYQGRIIGERYAPGFGPKTQLAGWSMSKSALHALVGILVKEGKLDIHARAPVAEWSDPADPRHKITLDQLLRMSSGLEFDETYADYESDVVQMLYRKADTGGYAASKPLRSEPDGEWYYSSGTSNLISLIVRQAVGGSTAQYWDFPHRALFSKIGMHHTTINPDPSGTFVMSSFMYASARDWARFGLLYLNDGVWGGERILPEGWVAYGVTPTPLQPQGYYGAHWWLNAGAPGNPADRVWPDLPTDAYAAQGFEAQRVLVIPSRELVVARLGLSRPEGAFDTNALGKAILEAIGRGGNRAGRANVDNGRDCG